MARSCPRLNIRVRQIDFGAWRAPGFSRNTRGVGAGVALSVAVPVMSSTPKCQIPRLRTAAERERHDVIDLQPIARAATPAAVAGDIAAATLVAAPHLPPHGSGDVPGPGARPRAEAAQRRQVPLQSRRTLRRRPRTMPGAVRKPRRRRAREPVSAAHRCSRRAAFAGFDMRFRRAGCTARNTARPLAPAIAASVPVPLRRRSGMPAAVRCRRGKRATGLGLRGPLRRRIGAVNNFALRHGLRAAALGLRIPLRRRNRPTAAIPRRRMRRTTECGLPMALLLRSGGPSAVRCRRG